jgi:hypothetical protein
MPAKIKRSPRASRRPLTIVEKLSILRAVLLELRPDVVETKKQ